MLIPVFSHLSFIYAFPVCTNRSLAKNVSVRNNTTLCNSRSPVHSSYIHPLLTTTVQMHNIVYRKTETTFYYLYRVVLVYTLRKQCVLHAILMNIYLLLHTTQTTKNAGKP